MKNINPLLQYVRKDIPGIFNEIDILKRHKTRFLHALNTDRVLPPYEILIHPSGVCNLHCRWCIGGYVMENMHKANDKVLPSLLWDPNNMEKIIKDILNYTKDGFRVENVSFSGITGEPLLSKKTVIKAVDLLSKNSVRTGIFSNAVLMDKELMNTLLKMNYINISLDAGTPKTYAKLKFRGNLTGEKLFTILIENIRKLTKLRSLSKTSKLDINASFVLYPDNYKEIYETAKMLKSIGIKTMRMKQDISGKLLLSSKQLAEAEKLIKKIIKLEDDTFKFITIHRLNIPSDRIREFDKCIISDLMAAIGSDGNVYPCNYQACIGSPVYGNALKKSFKSIWEGKTRMKIRKQLPNICPAVCDPFKNRANRLFNEIEKTQIRYGSGKTEKFIQEIISLY